MLSYYVPKKDARRKNTQWLAQGVFFARMAHADRYYSPANESKGRAHVATLKRLWWCCLLRDRILPLGLRRTLQIDHIEPEMDFLSASDFASELGNSRVHQDPAIQAQIFSIIRLTCKLAHALTQPMCAMFRVESFEERAWISADALSRQLQEMRGCIKRLQSWYEEANRLFPSPISLGDTDEAVTTFANMLFVYYEYANPSSTHLYS